MRGHTKHFVALAVVCALPFLNAADTEWRNLYSLGVNATTLGDFGESGRYLQPRAAGRRAVRQRESAGGHRFASGWPASQRLEKHLPEAEESARHALSIFITNPGEESLEYGQAEFSLAGILMDEGKYQPALDAVRKALPLIEASLGPNDTATADAICVEGDAFRLQKMYASAETPLKRCADMRADSNGVNTAEFGEAANSLALVYQHVGEYKEADRYFTYAAKIREVTLGITSPALADTLEAHALLLHQLGRVDEAKQKERMAAAIRARTGRK